MNVVREMTEGEWLGELRVRYREVLERTRYYIFPDAYQVMSYEFERETIRIWNSRNGVAPYSVIIEGKEGVHKDRGGDRLNFGVQRPDLGGWIFVDADPEYTIDSTKNFIDKEWETRHEGYETMCERFATKFAALVALTADVYREGVPPRLVQVDEELAIQRGWLKRDVS